MSARDAWTMARDEPRPAATLGSGEIRVEPYAPTRCEHGQHHPIPGSMPFTHACDGCICTPPTPERNTP